MINQTVSGILIKTHALMTGIKEVSIFVLENKIYRGIANDIGGSTRTNRIQYVINPFVFILNLDLARM